MLNSFLIKVVSDLEDIIQDFKYGLYSEKEFKNVLKKKCWELESVLKIPSIQEMVDEKIKASL